MSIKKRSAGLLVYRWRAAAMEVFLVHPGGPFWMKKDAGAWTIPKGELDAGEPPLACALREFMEETGFAISGIFLPLEPVQQKGGKWILAFAVEGMLDPEALVSNTFQIEWPPKSGNKKDFPEIDRGEWFSLADARTKINSAQVALIDELALRHHPGGCDP